MSSALLSAMEASPRVGTTQRAKACCSYSAPPTAQRLARGSRRGSVAAAAARPSSAGRVASPAPLHASAHEYLSLEGLGQPVEPRGAAPTWDVVGLGQAIIDFSANVDEEFLAAASVEKGGRRVISVDERAEIINSMDTDTYKVNAGGSLSNTLVALARLGEAAAAASPVDDPVPPLEVGLAGMLGDDHLGEFFAASMDSANVRCLSDPEPASSTGTVFVLTTNDAHRSFLSYPGTAEEIVLDKAVMKAIQSCRVLVIEGYLWEFPGALDSIRAAIEAAHDAGAIVALTAGDPGLVARHRSSLLAALRAGADMLFTNADEAGALLNVEGEPSADGCETPAHDAREAAARLGTLVPMCVVTDGSRGSYLAALGRLQCIPPHWAADVPVDTCGAGDAYAAGLLFGMLQGSDLRGMGRTAALVASAVIGQVGARLSRDDAASIVSRLPARQGAEAAEVSV